MQPELRDRVGLLCEQLSRWPSTEGIIRGAGAGDALDALQTALSASDAPDPDHVVGWLRSIDEACARAGLVGVTSRELAFQPLPAGFSVSGRTAAWVCPNGRCDRVVLPDETSTVPQCVVAHGGPLREFPGPSR